VSFCGNECRWDLNRLDRGSLWEAKENENGARSAFFGCDQTNGSCGKNESTIDTRVN